MKITQNGIDIIKKYEGLRLEAYLCPAGVWTIGYGHTAGVRKGMTITEKQAEEYLRKDCESSEKTVNALGRNLNQNQFDALVSFTFNCGAKNLKTLCHNRKLSVIAEKILLYNKGGGKVLNGLVRRRKEEQALFLRPMDSDSQIKAAENHSGIVDSKPVLRLGSKGQHVKEVQTFLTDKGMYHGANDGIFGPITYQAVIEWQGYCEITKDGIVGKCTWATME